MSHFTTIKVEIKDGVILHDVLRELGYSVELNAQVRGYQGKTTQADYVIRQANGYDVGFRQAGDVYEIVADFWGAKINQTELLNTIHQNYAHKTLMTFVNQQGFDVESNEILADGTVRVVVGKWV